MQSYIKSQLYTNYISFIRKLYIYISIRLLYIYISYIYKLYLKYIMYISKLYHNYTCIKVYLHAYTLRTGQLVYLIYIICIIYI